MILSEVRTRAKRVALKLTVPSLFRRMFIDTRRCEQQVKLTLPLTVEYHNVWLLFRIGSTHPLSRKLMYPPPAGIKGGGSNTRRRVEGVGGPNSDDWRESLAFCLVYSVPLRILHSDRVGNYEYISQSRFSVFVDVLKVLMKSSFNFSDHACTYRKYWFNFKTLHENCHPCEMRLKCHS